MSSHLYSKLIEGEKGQHLYLAPFRVQSWGGFSWCFKICSSFVSFGIFKVIMGLTSNVLAIIRGRKGGDFLLNAFYSKSFACADTNLVFNTLGDTVYSQHSRINGRNVCISFITQLGIRRERTQLFEFFTTSQAQEFKIHLAFSLHKMSFQQQWCPTELQVSYYVVKPENQKTGHLKLKALGLGKCLNGESSSERCGSACNLSPQEIERGDYLSQVGQLDYLEWARSSVSERPCLCK